MNGLFIISMAFLCLMPVNECLSCTKEYMFIEQVLNNTDSISYDALLRYMQTKMEMPVLIFNTTHFSIIDEQYEDLFIDLYSTYEARVLCSAEKHTEDEDMYKGSCITLGCMLILFMFLAGYNFKGLKKLKKRLQI